jgi:CubicO group peptidase (beta-lactamase class C family)
MRHLSCCGLLVLTIMLTASPVRGDGIAGVWDSNFGLVTLREPKDKDNKRPGQPVAGSWTQDIGKVGRIRVGVFHPKTSILEFDYHQPWNKQSGHARLKLSRDQKSLDGTWEQGKNNGEWTMKKLSGKDFASRVDSIVENAGVKEKDPGVAVLVIKKGKTTLCKTYGMAELRGQRKLTNETPIELASLSKTFTGVLTMQLVNEGKLDLRDDIRKHLPELPQYGGGAIQVLDLLHHTSGLPLYTQFQNQTSAKFIGLEDVVNEFSKQKDKFPSLFKCGDKYDYSNTNYMLLALIIQRLTKKSYSDIIRERIFVPCDMQDSWVYQRPDSPPKHATHGYYSAVGYYKDKKGDFQPNRTLAPNGNEFLLTCGDGYMWASINDIAKFDAGLRSRKLAKTAAMKRALQPSRTRDGAINMYGFGLSLANDDSGSIRTFGHTGGNGGVRTSYYHDAVQDYSIAVLCNRGDISADGLWNSINRLLVAENQN